MLPPGPVSHSEYADGTDRQMDKHTDVKPLRHAFRLGAASIIIQLTAGLCYRLLACNTDIDMVGKRKIL